MLIDIKTISQSTGAWQAIEIESQPEDFDLSSLGYHLVGPFFRAGCRIRKTVFWFWKDRLHSLTKVSAHDAAVGAAIAESCGF